MPPSRGQRAHTLLTPLRLLRSAVYARVGDSVALRIVLAFFNYVSAAVTKHDGIVLKTIGDSVLAVFQKSENAMAASLELQTGLGKLNTAVNEMLRLQSSPRGGEGGDAALATAAAAAAMQLNVHAADVPLPSGLSSTSCNVFIKVGINAGPAIAITTPDAKLDYYGTTLNVTARFEALCQAGDIISHNKLIADSLFVQSLLHNGGFDAIPFKTQLKGLPELTECARIVRAPRRNDKDTPSLDAARGDGDGDDRADDDYVARHRGSTHEA